MADRLAAGQQPTIPAYVAMQVMARQTASAPAGDGVEAFEAAAIEAERIGTRWAEDTDHPATSRAVGKAIAASIRTLSLARPHSTVSPVGNGHVLMPRQATRSMVEAADACTDAYSAYNAMVEAGHVR